ncbi:MAG: Type 1 glutamine amidotransferase-like domain-containing protein [Planctomycetia bacterium]|nr:Type 1 glutamine amidotransferase-like domain-containing protein [Planctomycetia bacterium]
MKTTLDPRARSILRSALSACFAIALLLLVQPVGTPFDSGPAPRIDPTGIESSLVVCGGKTPEAAIARFVELAGGEKARVVILRAGENGGNGGDKEKPADEDFKAWKERKLAALDVVQLPIEAADSAEALAPLKEATGVWIGDLPSEDALNGPVEKELRALVKRGGTMGVDANIAARLGRFALARDGKTTAGFDVLPGAIVLPAFDAEKDKQRLFDALAKNPGLFGIGIADGAALVVRGRQLRAVGDGAIALFLAASSSREARVIDLRSDSPSDLTMLRRAALARTQPPPPPQDPPVPELASGSLVIVGGGDMPAEATKKFIELAGGPESLIVILPTAVPGATSTSTEGNFLARAGAKNLKVLPGTKFHEVESKESLLALKEAKGIWFGGGRQWRFVDAYEKTRAVELFHGVLRCGGVIGGSSAGATIQGDYLCRGSPLVNTEMMCEGYERGFGFLPGVGIDQHFSQRKRFADMTALMKARPQLLGIGIDESTAIIVQGHVAEVLGKNAVHFYGGRKEVEEGQPDYESVKAGGKYDLKERKVLDAGGEKKNEKQ